MNIYNNTTQSEPQFRAQLKLFSNAKPRILTGYLIVKKDGSLGLTNLISKLWQSLKGAVGYCNFTNSRLIQLKTLQFFAQGKEWIKLEDKNQITQLAVRAGLTPEGKNNFDIETVEDDLTRLVSSFDKELKAFSPEILKINKTAATILQAPISQAMDQISSPQAKEEQSTINEDKDSQDKPTSTSEGDKNQESENEIPLAGSPTIETPAYECHNDLPDLKINPASLDATSDAKQPVTAKQNLVEEAETPLATKPIKAEIITPKTTSTWAAAAWKIAPYALLTVVGLGAAYGLGSLILRGISVSQTLAAVSSGLPVSNTVLNSTIPVAITTSSPSSFPFNFTGVVVGGLVGLGGYLAINSMSPLNGASTFSSNASKGNKKNKSENHYTKINKLNIEIQENIKNGNITNKESIKKLFDIFIEQINLPLKKINENEHKIHLPLLFDKLERSLIYFNRGYLNHQFKTNNDQLNELNLHDIIKNLPLNPTDLEGIFNSDKINIKTKIIEILNNVPEDNFIVGRYLELIKKYDFNIETTLFNGTLFVNKECIQRQEDIISLFDIQLELKADLEILMDFEKNIEKQEVSDQEDKLINKSITTTEHYNQAIDLITSRIEFLLKNKNLEELKALTLKLENHKQTWDQKDFSKLSRLIKNEGALKKYEQIEIKDRQKEKIDWMKDSAVLQDSYIERKQEDIEQKKQRFLQIWEEVKGAIKSDTYIKNMLSNDELQKLTNHLNSDLSQLNNEQILNLITEINKLVNKGYADIPSLVSENIKLPILELENDLKTYKIFIKKTQKIEPAITQPLDLERKDDKNDEKAEIEDLDSSLESKKEENDPSPTGLIALTLGDNVEDKREIIENAAHVRIIELLNDAGGLNLGFNAEKKERKAEIEAGKYPDPTTNYNLNIKIIQRLINIELKKANKSLLILQINNLINLKKGNTKKFFKKLLNDLNINTNI